MARPIRNCERKKQVKVKKTSGVTYVYEKTVIYDPKKRYDKVLSSRLIGKIMPGSEDIVATRPKRAPSSRKADAEDKKRSSKQNAYYWGVVIDTYLWAMLETGDNTVEEVRQKLRLTKLSDTVIIKQSCCPGSFVKNGYLLFSMGSGPRLI